MNAVSDHSDFIGASSQGSCWYVAARGRLLDACFSLEIAASRWLHLLGDKETTKPLGQRLVQLAGHRKLLSKASSKQAAHIESMTTVCEDLLRIRNACVHSHHEVGTKAGQPCVFLKTIEHVLGDGRGCVVLTLSELEEAAKQLNKLAGQLNNYLKQLS